MTREEQLEIALLMCEGAAGGSRFAWPKSRQNEYTSGTSIGNRVNRIGDIVSIVLGRNTYKKHREKDLPDYIVRSDCDQLLKPEDIQGTFRF